MKIAFYQQYFQISHTTYHQFHYLKTSKKKKTINPIHYNLIKKIQNLQRTKNIEAKQIQDEINRGKN